MTESKNILNPANTFSLKLMNEILEVSPIVAVVIPAYRVEREIKKVLSDIPDYIRYVIVVDDKSPDRTSEIVSLLAESDHRIILLRHESNQGVGGAMITGFRKALDINAQIVIKIDGDGQMNVNYIPLLIAPLILGNADYAKGNRFRDFKMLNQMPIIRRLGNLGLSFLAKAATGYWNCFDPTNGFLAIRTEVLAQLPLERIDHTYFFETSMLSYLYLQNATVYDASVPARYQGEISSLSIRRVLLEFPYKLFRTFLSRILLKYYLYDFSMVSIYILTSLPLIFGGLTFGIYKWFQYATLGIPAPTGTVMLPTLSLILGIQLLLSAIEGDVHSVPTEPISKPLSQIRKLDSQV
ncbi:MAG: glycosyltransferase family 2 protein [Chloroflexi bacterium]|nr:glycosyltransferase family 2 protein [Chloroflexota bacterium]